MQDLSSLTKGQTHPPCSGNAVLTTGPQGKSKPKELSFKDFQELSFMVFLPREEPHLAEVLVKAKGTWNV